MPANEDIIVDVTFPRDLELSPWDPSRHAPFVGLINPSSGGKKGFPILEVCRRTKYYDERMFHIVEVVKGGQAMINFRKHLNGAKQQAMEKNDAKFRPRLICGGGDGTAAFAMLVVFKALLADNEQEGCKDTGNGFSWTDEELEKYFPALVQMPLGTGNDLGGVLGWGRKYPGFCRNPCAGPQTRGRNLRNWFNLALLVTTPVVSFDVWGFMPAPGQEVMDVKMCELAGIKQVNGKQMCVMKKPDVVVPFLVLLYSSYGFSAHVVARFQLKRTNSQLKNLGLYANIGTELTFGKDLKELRGNMTGMSVTNLPGAPLEKNGTDRYFPPRTGRKDKSYSEVGFLNINSYSGGVLHGLDRASVCRRWCMCSIGRRPVDSGDGKADFFRQRSVRTICKTGRNLQTDKKDGATFHFEGSAGQGIFFQYDGEGRFAFHPQGNAWRMDIQRVMTIPVVATRNSVAASGEARGKEVRFSMIGEPAEAARVKARILKWVHGDLVQELNATEDDIRSAGLELDDPSLSPKSGPYGGRNSL
eukprot:gnl/TRDRNA2_/TRDRNA2_199074_c0_seq1.p1 gnl/TRDRNA2_/TRDRNA2_199074_c0~~gnl/TRDRNA2_/TRDRNA2_199074_c0_seq1.p1  ORF type:complete len:530 (+),score=81.11 gnl/TRDRNA2_/TRDRNA2_199074_c0_seq1:60-1649(+)